VKRRLACLSAALLALAAAPAALANGDPASDVLPFKTVFLSSQAPSSSPAGRGLLDLTNQAVHKKLPIRVAVIYQQPDLGLIQSLWRRPQPYANFLGRELVAFGRYHGTLLVAMPNGFGVYGPGATPRAKRALAGIKPSSGSLDDLGRSAEAGVVAVAKANGATLEAPSSSHGTPAWVIILIVLGGAALIAGVAFVALRGWLTRPATP
jgi:hypothetical protein